MSHYINDDYFFRGPFDPKNSIQINIFKKEVIVLAINIDHVYYKFGLNKIA